MTKRTTSIITLLTMALLLVPGAALLPQADAMGHENTCPAVPNPNADLQLDGAGASFSFPLIDLWRVEYGKEFPNVQLNYQSIGSGGGVKNHIAKTIVFAGSDAPLKPAEREAAPNTLHIPEAIGGVTVAYNIPEVPESGLKLTGTVIADIFLGKITKFNDPAIQDLNPEISLPDKDIVVAHRSDGSGTTFVFTSYLNQVSAEWDEKVGAGKSVEWPAGIGGKGNEGVANVVKTTPYSIGYIELAYAFQNNIKYAYVENADGTAFVEPSMSSFSDASAGAAPILPKADESWYGVSLLNAPGDNSYPIATFTYILVYDELNQVTNDKDTAQAIVHAICWMVTDGQQYNKELLYVPISPEVVDLAMTGLKKITFNGENVFNMGQNTAPEFEVVIPDMGASPAGPKSGVELQIDGAGASFPFPLIDLWRVEYGKEYPNVQLNYQSIGSGGGVKNHIAKTIVFAGSDAPLKPAEREAAPNTLHIPEAIGAVTIAFNIPEFVDDEGRPVSTLQLSGDTIADIFLGKITQWDDQAIIDDNPTLYKKLPKLSQKDIIVAHRSDGSGTTFVFTSYLNQVSAEWDEKVGAGKSVEWPAGIGGKGNEGVANVVKTTPYSIGYIELAYAFQNNIPYAHVMNADGTSYVKPSMKTIAAASAGAAPTLPAAHESWYGVSLLNAPGYDSYPIATFTYLLLYENLNEVTDDPATAQALMHMIHWIITKGQNYNDDLLYVPIAPEVMKIGIDGLKRVQFDGEPAWTASGIGSGPAPAAAAQTASSESSEGGGCLIATAAFGSEMAPQVQFLREIRDGKVMATQSGTAFMTGFNQFYYSFSPAVADYERENPVFKETVKVALTPMLSSLALLNFVNVDTEEQMLGWGISLILLNIGMYFVAPAVIIAKIKKRLRK